MSNLRRQVLTAFKKLHRTRQYVFQGDTNALAAGRLKINESFLQNRSETNEDEIQKMIKLAQDVDLELRTNVIQAEKKKEGVYELRITPETTRLDNVVFNPDAIIEKPRRRRGEKNTEGCCGGAAMAALESEVQARNK
ncbi:complex III assembly factor LYRM7 [Drosophila subpulchrella]|uniref:complex III assembly factor LYRM7 n=1 Tax=Drosophila subpulchrella TaxID=1486046 RepID=UPI0018A1290D|nr:complex III assembly factor LYRM7 [Drosophila subpulchrella]